MSDEIILITECGNGCIDTAEDGTIQAWIVYVRNTYQNQVEYCENYDAYGQCLRTAYRGEGPSYFYNGPSIVVYLVTEDDTHVMIDSIDFGCAVGELACVCADEAQGNTIRKQITIPADLLTACCSVKVAISGDGGCGNLASNYTVIAITKVEIPVNYSDYYGTFSYPVVYPDIKPVNFCK